ncbi:LAFA_0D11870g1_1 [Lachancea sp. 'fantastica']|nr:LAFA_0D11870g1_1 [Lachancea sp. 'fantastica']
MNCHLVNYLIENHKSLLAPPVSGRVADISTMFAMHHQSSTPTSGKLQNRHGEGHPSSTGPKPQFEKFWDDLVLIEGISPGCLSFSTLDDHKDVDATIEYIDVETLRIMANVVSPGTYEEQHSGNIVAKVRNDANSTLADRLYSVLNSHAADTPNQQRLDILQQTLNVKTASYVLGRERASKFTPHTGFIPICANKNHCSILSSIAAVSNNKVVAMDVNKVQHADQDCPGLYKCAHSKIHYIPNLKPQTDPSLGDCSYLDTCHKLNSCRYVHYLQYMPETLAQTTAAGVTQMNEASIRNKQICLYTQGLNCSVASQPTLPAQWIRCDIRKFDFNILGKFSVIVADPAWNIRMNLPYGTCNDSELADLPLDLLQHEGIIFLWVTGRAIEVGKTSLQKWGYQVCNEVSWIKTNQLGRTIVTGRTGHWLNHSKEHLLVGVKGSARWLTRQSDIDLIVSASRETSRKPDELYGMIERLVGPHARKLEIFGRDHNTRPGWFTIGNQLNGDRVCELDVKTKYNQYLQNQSRSTVPRYSAFT